MGQWAEFKFTCCCRANLRPEVKCHRGDMETQFKTAQHQDTGVSVPVSWCTKLVGGLTQQLTEINLVKNSDLRYFSPDWLQWFLTSKNKNKNKKMWQNLHYKNLFCFIIISGYCCCFTSSRLPGACQCASFSMDLLVYQHVLQLAFNRCLGMDGGINGCVYVKWMDV